MYSRIVMGWGVYAWEWAGRSKCRWQKQSKKKMTKTHQEHKAQMGERFARWGSYHVVRSCWFGFIWSLYFISSGIEIIRSHFLVSGPSSLSNYILYSSFLFFVFHFVALLFLFWLGCAIDHRPHSPYYYSFSIHIYNICLQRSTNQFLYETYFII